MKFAFLIPYFETLALLLANQNGEMYITIKVIHGRITRGHEALSRLITGQVYTITIQFNYSYYYIHDKITAI
jgi:hypothetical protein